jgi:lysyl-tRNA synthetase class I
MGAKMISGSGATIAHPASTTWIPRAVRCAHCGEVAREQVRERVSDDEVVVRYGCSTCRWRQTRHFHENEAV